jgi:ribosomal protein L7Ae-like RNA K-turn-binding protein
MRQQYLWLAVTPDQYELPLAVVDTAEQLGALYGLSRDSVASMVCKGASGKRTGRKFIKVEV